MPTFSSNSRAPPSAIVSQVRRRPFIFFGLPFLSLMVGASFALQGFTKTRYDYQGQKVQTMNKEEQLGMSKDRKRVDIREEYYRLNGPVASSDRRLDADADTDAGSASYSYPSSGSSIPPLSSAGPAGIPELPPSLPSRPLDSSDTPRAPIKRPKLTLKPVSQDEYEPVRVPRPAGMPEWGAGISGEEAPLKGRRKEDRWV